MPPITDIDHIAGQNDHWLFIGSILFIVTIGITLWRFMIQDRDKREARLTEMTDRHIQSCERLGDIVAANTAVLARVEKKL